MTHSASARRPLAPRLPDFPWDTLEPVIQRAHQHPQGAIDLTVGSPVDPVPSAVAEALCAHAHHPGYPPTLGIPGLRSSISAALARRYGMADIAESAILPVVGTKEIIAQLPWMLGVGAGNRVAIPEIAYPTYDIAGRLCGAECVAAEESVDITSSGADLVYLNSPSNPTGRVREVDELRAIVDWARNSGAIVVSDECYLGLDYSGTAVSILHPTVCGDSHDNLIAIHSLSKTSNMASYRAGYVCGDRALMAELIEIRKHCGLSIPRAIQHAMIVALNDDSAEHHQRSVYEQRHRQLRDALETAGHTVDFSQAGLYLWVAAPDGADSVVASFAELGIIVAPGTFYGNSPDCEHHVRMSLTATDTAISTAAERIRAA